MRCAWPERDRRVRLVSVSFKLRFDHAQSQESLLCACVPSSGGFDFQFRAAHERCSGDHRHSHLHFPGFVVDEVHESQLPVERHRHMPVIQGDQLLFHPVPQGNKTAKPRATTFQSESL